MGKDDDKPKTITLDPEALKALVDAQVEAKLAERAGQPPPPEVEDFEEQMKRARGMDRPAPKVRYEECESPLTGATFRAKIMQSRSSPLGRVVDLEDYTYPAGCDVPVSQGGRVPDEDMKNPERTAFWLYWNVQRLDRIEFASGKLFTTYLLRSEAEKRREADRRAAATTATSPAV